MRQYLEFFVLANFVFIFSCGLEIIRNINIDDVIPKSLSHKNDNEDNYYFNELNSKENKRDILLKVSNQQENRAKPPISKIYLKNVTLMKGDMAILRCHQNQNDHKQNSEKKKSRTNIISSDHNSKSGSKHHLDESISIKTIIWSYESTSLFPKLLTKNDEILMKSKRFNFVNSSNKSANNDKNEDYVIKQIKKSNYDLKICPVKVSDSGWYSCYVVKKHLTDQNVKYFTYLHVLDSHDKPIEDYDQNLDIDSYYNDDYDFEPESVVLIKQKIDSCKKMSQNEYNNRILLTKSSTSLKNDYSKTIPNNKPNSKEESLFFDEFNKNTTLKRQIENELKLKESQNLNRNALIISNPSTINAKLTTTISTTTTTISTTKILTTTLILTTTGQVMSDSETQSISSMANNDAQNQKLKIKEKLTMSPKYLNVSQFKSFQFDCVYNGNKYLNIDLVWSKNGKYLDLANHNRILSIEYKQNNTKISILKFSYALLNDAGIYNCSALNSFNKKKLFSEASHLILHHSSKSEDRNFKYSSYLESDDASKAFKLGVFQPIFSLIIVIVFDFVNKYFYI